MHVTTTQRSGREALDGVARCLPEVNPNPMFLAHVVNVDRRGATVGPVVP